MNGVTRKKARKNRQPPISFRYLEDHPTIVTNLVSALFVDGFWIISVGESALSLHCRMPSLISLSLGNGTSPAPHDLTKGFFTQGSRSESVGMLMLYRYVWVHRCRHVQLRTDSSRIPCRMQWICSVWGPCQNFVGSCSSEEGLVMNH